MSLSSALSVALSGLQVSTAQLQLTANNIANAQTAGYTAKTANVGSVVLGGQSGGATISGFTRATNDGLANSYNAATAESSFLSTQNNYMKQVQALLNSTADNPALSDAVAQFQSAWTQFSAAPEDAAQQQAVIQAGSNLATQIRNVSSGVQQLNQQVVKDTSGTVGDLNTDLKQLASLNSQIATASANPNDPGAENLEDTRDQLVNKISAITKVTAVARSNNQIALYTPSGLLLLDGTPQTFSFNGTAITNASGLDVTKSLIGGSLEAETQFITNSSPATASSSPGSEVIRKLNSQITALTNAFTGTTGSPTSFAAAYNGATTATGELASSFFTVTTNAGVPDPTTFAVNANLLNGTSTVKEASGSAVTASLTATRSFTADGLSVAAGTYGDLTTAILSNFQSAANTISSQSATASQQQTYYQQSLSNATGVNVDNELVNLTTLQNSYAASAHVISTINQMLQELTSLLGG